MAKTTKGEQVKHIKFKPEDDVPLTMIGMGDLVIVRGPYSGVHIGVLDTISADKQVACVREARTIAEWTEVETTFDIAEIGCGDSSVFTEQLKVGIISDICAISKVSDVARAKLAGRPKPITFSTPREYWRDRKENKLHDITRGDLVLVRGPYSGVHIGILDEYTENAQVALMRYVKTVAEWSESETTIDVCALGAGDSSTLSENLEVGEISDVCAIYLMSDNAKQRFETQGHYWPDALFGLK